MAFVVEVKGQSYVIIDETLFQLVELKGREVEQIVEVDELEQEVVDELIPALQEYYITDEIDNALSKVEIFKKGVWYEP